MRHLMLIVVLSAACSGEKGATGERGVQGPAGEPGTVGPRGPEGPRGEAGPAGPDGEPGQQGERGERGFRGADGEDYVRSCPEAAWPISSSVCIDLRSTGRQEAQETVAEAFSSPRGRNFRSILYQAFCHQRGGRMCTAVECQQWSQCALTGSRPDQLNIGCYRDREGEDPRDAAACFGDLVADLTPDPDGILLPTIFTLADPDENGYQAPKRGDPDLIIDPRARCCYDL